MHLEGGDYVLDAPLTKAEPVALTDVMRRAFPMALVESFTAGPNLYIVAEKARDIVNFEPDFSAILPLSHHGVGLTAVGEGSYDMISRFFFPAEGIDEDSVTGSAHAVVGPYWADKLGKTKLFARQASARGGDLKISVKNNRVDIAGPAVTYLRGTISI